jgi:phosphohistidine phosphatase
MPRMELLLVRHGVAVDEAPGLGDTGRWLTAKGRKLTRRVARWLGKSDKRRPALIWSSPLARALQSAEILAAAIDYEGEIRVVAELSPGRDPGDLIKLFDEATSAGGPLALVGHEPSLTLLASTLLGDQSAAGRLRKSGVIAIELKEGAARFRFLLDPAEMKKEKRLDSAPRTPRAESLPPPAGDEQ